MHRAMHEIKVKLKYCDLVVNVLDARCIRATMNTELLKLTKNTPLVHIALKSSLADADFKAVPSINYLDIAQCDFCARFKSIIIEKLHDKIAKLKTKGLKKPQLTIFVVGLPNVGKSSLINRLSRNHKAIVQNTPGVTRNLQLIKISDCVAIYDTPGILYNTLDHIKVSYILATVGCINPAILPIDKIVEYNCNFYFKFYEKEIREYFNFKLKYEFEKFIDFICQKYFLISHGNKLDLRRAYMMLFKLFKNSTITKVSYDREEFEE